MRVARFDAREGTHGSNSIDSHLLLAECLCNRAEPEAARGVCQAALALAEAQPDDQDRSAWSRAVQWRRALSVLGMGDLGGAEADLRPLLDGLREDRNANLTWTLALVEQLSWVRGLRGDWREADALAREALSLADLVYPPGSVFRLAHLAWRSRTLHEIGGDDEALQLARSTLARVERCDARALAWREAYHAARVVFDDALRRGHLPPARRMLRAARHALAATPIENNDGLARFLLLSARLHLHASNPGVALPLARRAAAMMTARLGARHPFARDARAVLDLTRPVS